MGDTIKGAIQKLNKYAERFADKMADLFGHPLFLIINVILWIVWIGGNFEPFPYGELTMILSMQAIIMSVLILNSSTRKGHEDSRMMKKDLDISRDIHDDLDDIHDDIEDIKSMLGDEEHRHE